MINGHSSASKLDNEEFHMNINCCRGDDDGPDHDDYSENSNP